MKARKTGPPTAAAGCLWAQKIAKKLIFILFSRVKYGVINNKFMAFIKLGGAIN